MMKVIQVITDTNIGGAGIWLLNFLKSYDRTLVDMAVVIPENSMLKEKIETLGVRVITAEGIADSSFSVSGIKSLDCIFKEENPDIVHTHASLSARIAARKNKIRVVHTRHCLEDDRNFLKKFIFGVINNYLSDRVIAVSEAVMENLKNDGISPEKLRLCYNGIFPLEVISDEKKQFLRQKYGIGEDKVIVGMVARLEEVKNHNMFIEMAKVVNTICPETVFMIVGDGSLYNELLKKARLEGIADKVIFTGYIDNVNDIMNIIDIHVLTSYKEALSISLIEAMSLEKPVVATDSGGPGEVIENGKNGILVGVNDAVNLTMGIVKFIQKKEVRESAGREGRRIVEEKFLAGNMARNIEKIYEEIL